MLAELVSTAPGLRIGRNEKAADVSGLTSAGKSPEIWTLKKRAGEETEYMISVGKPQKHDEIYLKYI